jgi:hypothetical protein
MSSHPIDDLRTLLQRPVEPSERHSVASLDRISDAQLAEARELRSRGGVGAIMYLRFLVRDASLSDAQEFAEDVLEKGAPAATWRTGPTLFIPSVPRSALLGVSARTFQDRLQSIEGVRWRRLAATASRSRWTNAPGEPGVFVADANHTIRAPEGTEALVLGAASVDVETVPDLAIGVRRWFAARMARHLDEARIAIPGSGHEVLQALGASENATDDARIAAHALVREVSLAGVHEVPLGFRGPADWYA